MKKRIFLFLSFWLFLNIFTFAQTKHEEFYLKELNSKLANEISEANLSPKKERSVFLPEYGITVRTDLKNPNEIKFNTDTSILKQSKDMYYQLGRIGESKRDYKKEEYKELFFKILRISGIFIVIVLVVYFIIKYDKD